MILKCPHCLKPVLVAEDKICPSCHNNVEVTIGLNKDNDSENLELSAENKINEINKIKYKGRDIVFFRGITSKYAEFIAKFAKNF